MAIQKFGPYPVTLPAAKRWDPIAKSFTGEIPEEHGNVMLEIDVDALIRVFGKRALANKSGQAKEAGGAIVLRRVYNKR